MGEYEVISKVLGPFKTYVFDAISEYVRYIGNCDDNLEALHKSLRDVCSKKDGIKKKVKLGNDEQQEISPEAFNWLHDVQMLAEEEDIKELMCRDINTAKLVLKMMGKKNLKRRINNESEMQEVVVKVMKKLKEEMEHSEEAEEEEGMRDIRVADYKHVAEVVVEVMKNTIDDFKRLMKEDKNMAAIAMRTLKGKDLDKLTKDDQEMKEIVREAANANDEEEQWRNYDDEESSAPQPLLVKISVVDMGNNKVKEAAKKLFTPLANLITPLGKLMDDANFKNTIPEAGGVKLGLEVIDGLLIRGRGSSKEMNDNTKQHRGCCCCSLSLYDNYHGRYLMSTKAECMVKHIKDELISRFPSYPVTLPIRRVNLKDIPTQFFEGLVSRTKLLNQILERLEDDKANVVGVFGMGGAGKTTLAKEVSLRAKDAFAINVMVEISDAPDFVRIQATIAESIGLPLHDIHSVSERAIRLYNKLFDVKKEKKILIILDNIWKKLNLDEVGIPNTCKLLLTTRDKEVCRVMDVQDNNILEVGVMNTNEARDLFKSLTGNQVDAKEYKNVVEKLLRKCGGLPLAIVATANSLKDKNLYSWVKFANDLEKPISSQRSGGDYHHTFTILNTSYKFIELGEKRIFFLLACLSPLGSSVSIESLMRYGMGLNLFEYVNKLSEAMEVAVTWANELMLASMLLEGDVKGDVKVHDIVRDFAISYAAKEEEHKFMVEVVPRWMDDETLKKYTAISLTSKNDYYRLSRVEVCKLQILILKGDLSSDFNAAFFNGMVNLKVLALSNIDFKPALPESMRKLNKLRTLCIEGCKLGNFELVGELVNLLVLSLRGSSMENIPDEIGNLRKLQILDLGGCTSRKLPLIPTSVLNKLSRLEGLYMYNKWHSVFGEEPKYEEANVIENIRLPYLNAFEIKVKDIEKLPFDGQTIENLDEFRISLGDVVPGKNFQKFSRSLYLHKIDTDEFIKISGLEVLFKKVEYLKMKKGINLENVVPQLDQEGFKSLRSLHLQDFNDMKCIFDGCTMNNMIFPRLRSLKLNGLKCLEKICNEDVSSELFSNLRTIKLCSLYELRYGLPLVPRNVEEIQVTRCSKLEYIFIEDEEVQSIELPFLKTLQLSELPCLLSLVGPKNFSNTSDEEVSNNSDEEVSNNSDEEVSNNSDEEEVSNNSDKEEVSNNSDEEEVSNNSDEEVSNNSDEEVSNTSDKELITGLFFGEKIGLPSLELLILELCDNVVKLWGKEIHTPGFQNLKDIQISYCHGLLSVGPASVFSSLVQLENLSISKCYKMHEIIFHEEPEEPELGEHSIIFPRLKSLVLEEMGKLKCLYGGQSKLVFPKLKKLILKSLWSMKMFAKSDNSSALFHEKIDFPCLEELSVRNVNHEVTELWDKQSLTTKIKPAPMLRQLEVGSSSTGFPQIPSTVLTKISSLRLVNFLFQNGGALFSLSNSREEDEFIWIYSQLPKLEVLKVKRNDKLKELFEKEDNPIINDVLTSFCGQVKELELNSLPSLNMIPVHLFKSVVSLTFSYLKWDYLTSADVLTSLHQLQSLTVDRCQDMEALVINVGLQIEFPSLKHLRLSNLNWFKNISSMPKHETTLMLPSLETLVVAQCSKVEHFWQGSIFAPRLQDVSIENCIELQHFLEGDVEDTIKLPSLRNLSFTECKNLKSISKGSITAPKLRKVELTHCSNMEYLFPGNQNDDGDLQLPALEVVDIRQCWNFHKFSLRRVVAPKLTQITYNAEEYSMLPYNDLNHLFREKNPTDDDDDNDDDINEDDEDNINKA